MQRTLLACAITALACTSAWAGTPRIVGGDDVTTAPSWMGALQYRATNGSYSQFCGATLIDDEWVLTAAHCVEWVELDRMSLLLGQANLSGSSEGIKIDQLILYPGWLPNWELSSSDGSRAISQFAGDLALLHLKQPQSATPITLATPSQLSSLGYYQDIRAIGWGATDRNGNYYPDQLQGIDLPYLGKDATSGLASHIFAGGEDGENICFGDSGGPLYLSGTPDVQYGIDSFVTSLNTTAITCGDSGGVAGFTSVADYRDWIQQQLTGLSYTTTQNLSLITGTTGQANFVIRNNSAQEWTISSLTTDGGTLSDDCQSAALQPGSSCNVTVAYTAGKTGSSRTINLSFNASSADDAIVGQMQLLTTALADPNSSDDDDDSGGGAFGQLGLLLLTLLAAGRRLGRRQPR